MDFISNKKHVCPVCDNHSINYECMNTEHIGDGMIYIPWWCTECGTEGEEWYELSFTGHNVVTEDGIPITVNLKVEE